jgi:hypothetical protein
MDGQRVPDLELMDEHQVRHFLAEQQMSGFKMFSLGIELNQQTFLSR